MRDPKGVNCENLPGQASESESAKNAFECEAKLNGLKSDIG